MRPRRDWMPWNDGERESLHNACADPTLTWGDIGQLIGRTGYACRVEAAKCGWVPRVNLPRHRNSVATGAAWTDAEDDALVEEWANASTDVFEIAEKHGRTAQAIHNRAHKMQLGRKPIRAAPPPTQLSAEYVAELRRRGISQASIDMMGRK